MSVPAYRRNQSNMEFLNNFETIRRNVYDIVIRDLGVKSKPFIIDDLSEKYQIEEDDKFFLREIVKKYNISERDVTNQMGWIVDQWKEQLMNITNNIGIYILAANNTHIITFNTFESRIKYWDLASTYCYALINKLQEIVQLARVKSGEYRVTIEAINKELKLINGLRASDRKKYNTMVKQGAIKREEDIDDVE